MKKGSTLFLKIVIIFFELVAVSICTYLIVDAIIRDLSFFHPVIILLTVSTIPFVIALYQGLKLLSYIDKNTAFSELSVKALQNIKYCAVAISVFFTLSLPFMFQLAQIEDAPGLVLFTLIIVGASVVIAVFAAVLQKLVKNAIDIKTENELTV